MDDMVPGSQSRYRHRNEGRSVSDSGQARSFSLPATHEYFLSGSAGSMAYSSPSNSTMAGLMRSQVPNDMENVVLPTNTQSHHFGWNVPPGYWGGFQDRRIQAPAEDTSRTLPSHSHGIPISGSDIVGARTWLGHSPSLQLGQSYLDVAGNVPMGCMSNTNAGQNAFQLDGSAGDRHWREYGVMPSLYQPWSYQNQSTDGGFLSASLGNNTLLGTWFHDQRGDVGGHSYQTIAPHLDAGLLETGLGGNWTGGYQSHNNNNNPGVDNIYSHGTMLDDGGQASEQTAPYAYDRIAEDAVRGAYEFDYWIAHGRPPSPAAHASSSAPPIPYGSSPEPQEQGQSIEQGVPTANYPWLLPKASPSFQRQTRDLMFSPYNEAGGARSFQSYYDQTISDQAVLRDPTKSGQGSWFPACAGQVAGADAGGSSSSAFPKPIRVTPTGSSPRAIPPHFATGHRDQPVIIDDKEEPFLLFGRPLLPQRSAKQASSSRRLKRRHDQSDLTPSDLQLPLRHTRIRADSGDDMPELLGYKCQLCNMDLALKPTGSSNDAVPVHVVLPCGHSYHSSCFEEVHGFVGRNENPPCVCCSEGGAERRN
ncbi:uncharacterized protein LOC120113095 [Phoenix dactylifera]|uniref:Uncharacterized protein LOC120113095 n=1 Tax=Phoenix dactylifera TaxID=42345 RepID=A0A8B9AW20_PHODC|nr:uncharacterized protein LOC120113095 [Phoenix dactylifera]